jgi:hypothetical protein
MAAHMGLLLYLPVFEGSDRAERVRFLVIEVIKRLQSGQL